MIVIILRDIKSLDLNLLKALDALLDERSVTRAATRLALTQPAVSGMLTLLRDGFEDPLFVRTPRGLVPTERALALGGPVKRLLGELEALLRPAPFSPTTADFTLTHAATDYASQVIVVPLLAFLRRLALRVRVRVEPIDPEHLLARLERGDVDLALTTPETAAPEPHAQRLLDETYVCALREGHPAAAGASLTLDAFCGLDHALVSFAGAFSGVTDTALAKLGLSRRVALSMSSFLLLPGILRTTDLISVVPRRLLADTHGLVACEPPVEVPGFTKVVVWHERSHRDPRQAWVRDLLVETCDEPLPVQASASPRGDDTAHDARIEDEVVRDRHERRVRRPGA